jgi:hypothetical protein
MLALAFCTVLAATIRNDENPQPGLIAITLAEARRLFTALASVVTRRLGDVLTWSTWRRRHQARARSAHYHRRIAAGHGHDLRL